LFKVSLLIFLLFLFGCWSDNSSPSLKVYSYSSFQSHYGPGPEIVKAFEKQCYCNVSLVNAGDAGLLLQKLSLDAKSPDVVIGLDQHTLKRAERDFQWQPLQLKQIKWQKALEGIDKTYFAPINYSPLTFLYKKSVHPVQNFASLISQEFENKIIIQNPQSSSPGFHLLNWLSKTYKDSEEFKQYIKRFSKSIYQVSPSWTSSYGLFNNDKAPVVFTYLTSLVYHQQKDHKTEIQAMKFAGSHPVQIEFIGIPKKSKNKKLAQEFVNFLLAKSAQKIIMQKNYMLPAIEGVTVGTLFAQLPNLNISYKKFQLKTEKQRVQLIQLWQEHYEP
jgi:thiamine transport system substrate-binding protein